MRASLSRSLGWLRLRTAPAIRGSARPLLRGVIGGVVGVVIAAAPALAQQVQPVQSDPAQSADLHSTGSQPTNPSGTDAPAASPAPDAAASSTSAPGAHPTPIAPSAAPLPAAPVNSVALSTTETPAPAPQAPPSPAPEPEVPSPLARKARADNAHASRAVLFPTAFTHTQGTVVVTSYDIILLQASYSFTDDIQLSYTMTPPLEGAVPFDFTLKGVIHRGKRVRAALLGSSTGVVSTEFGGVFGRVGAVVQLCVTPECLSSFNSGVHVGMLGPVTAVVTSNSFIWHLGDWFEWVSELAMLVPLGEIAGEYHGAALGMGFRLPRPRWALDVMFETPVSTRAIPIPVIAFSGRFPGRRVD